MQLLDRLKRFDAYPKTLEEVQVRTTSGATISIVSMVIIFVLVVSEFSAYISTGTHHELYVDTTVGEQLQINFDVTFPRLACAYVSVDLMDVSGNHELDVDHNIFKKRLSSDGIPVGEDVLARVLGDPLIEIPEKRPGCGTCYSAERSDAQCCNTCTEVMDAYRSRGWAVSQPETIAQCQREGYNQLLKEQKDEGCQLYGTLQVSKAAGNFHFAPGKSFQQHNMHVHDMQPLKADSFDLSHQINHLSFGHQYPGLVNPLDDTQKTQPSSTYAAMFQYFVKIVPTIYESSDQKVIKTSQFSVTEHFRSLEKDQAGHSHGLPGVFFMYDLSPIMVTVRENSMSFGHFLTSLCAIIGGVFTVAGIIDSLVYRGMASLSSKRFA